MTARPPFHVEHIGSFVRPQRLLDAVRARRAGKLDDAAVRQAQDDAIRDIVAFQEDIGIPSITDGEFRRRSWSAGFIDAIDGFGLREGALGFRTSKEATAVAASPYARAPLSRKQAIVADDFRFLKSVVKRGVPKVTIAAPDVMHFFLGPKSYDTSVYPDRESYLAALAKLYKDEIAELAREGCTYLQLDDTALPCNCDDHARADVVKRGENPDELTARYVRLHNDAVSGRPKDMTIGIHLCRGNLKGTWMAEGGYDPIAEQLFNGIDADVFCLEYDTARAGDFTPLRFVPKGKRVILGLVSSKTPMLESKDAIVRRIEGAAKFVPLEQLGISPQCGFSSVGGGGQTVDQDDTRRKLELLVDIATDVWGSV